MNDKHIPVNVAALHCSCGKVDCEHLTDAQRIDFYSGAYDMSRWLLTSPCMKKAQREIIEEVVMDIKNRLEKLGVEFNKDGEQA